MQIPLPKFSETNKLWELHLNFFIYMVVSSRIADFLVFQDGFGNVLKAYRFEIAVVRI